MNKGMKTSIFFLRLALGWTFLYAGLTKVLNPEWSASGFLGGAKTFSGMYAWFASPANIGWVNFLNEWGLTLIGIALILGLFVRFASWVGILIMALYYFPGLTFPYVNHSFLVDEHIIYILILLLLIKYKEKHLGIDKFIPWIKK